MRSSILALAWVGLWPIAAWAQLLPSEAAVVEAYKAAIRSAESGTSAGAIEAAYSKIDDLRKALIYPRRGQDGPGALESLSDEEFSSLEDSLPGVLIDRQEAVFVQPDLEYFSKLAGKRGSGADQAFFAAQKATYSGSIWRVYIAQQTDYSGCTRFGSMSLAETYRVWVEFQSSYPGRYASAAEKEIEAVLSELTTATCACDDRGSVERELLQFNARFPSSPARTKIEERIQSLRAGRSGIRFSCQSG